MGFRGIRLFEGNVGDPVIPGDARVLDDLDPERFVVVNHGEYEFILVSAVKNPRGGFPVDRENSFRGILLPEVEGHL